MNRETLTAELKRRAVAAGFDAVGVAEIAPLERDEGMLRRWLEAGRHATMHWMARDPQRRGDPGRLLPGCRSVVVLAMNYLPPPPRAAAPPGTARVSLYARGRDYHRVLGNKLRTLSRWLEEASGQPARSFVDTGPVLERGWAERAGVGWIGKNANLIRRDLGSWLLLGEILSVAQLDPDAGPHADFCGSCTACLDACPTEAIVAPGEIDSWRCISYWTIEHRGTVPEPHRSGNGDWIFGCDVCQDVCPWNRRFGRPRDDDPFQWRDELRGLEPETILGMDEATFRERFSGTALMRARWDGMRRNACIVLGNRGNPGGVPALRGALGDADPMIRRHAAWALGRIGGAAASRALGSALARERDPDVRDELSRARLQADAPAASSPDRGGTDPTGVA